MLDEQGRPGHRRRLALVGLSLAALLVTALVVTTRPTEQAARPETSTSVSSTTVAATTTTLAPASTAAPATTRPRSTTSRPPPTTVPTVPTTVSTSGPAVAIRRGDPARRVVALTFDAGSDAGSTAHILDILSANGIRATFGMTGRWAESYPALVGRIAAEGHQVANHSYDHPSFTGLSTSAAPLTRTQRLDQLARADAAIRAVTGATTQPWFRPPYGDEDAGVRADVGAAGYRYELMWTVDSLGWKGLGVQAIVERCLAQAVPGAIFLFHVGSASADHAALQDIVDGLRTRGYGFVTATGLVGG